jgi:hypothetical protein
MLKPVLVGALGLTVVVSAAAYARTHTSSERDSTIDLCRTTSKADAFDRLGDTLAKADLSAEDRDYVLDMCYAYVSGLEDG